MKRALFGGWELSGEQRLPARAVDVDHFAGRIAGKDLQN